MNLKNITFLLCLSFFLSLSAVGATIVFAADESAAAAPAVTLKEMPLLRGDTWLKMTQDEKVAFVWGMGHIITMERERISLHPDFEKESFASKMAEGLAGVPMNQVVGVIDQFYKENPDKTGEPVVKVIWDKLVIPKIKASGTTPSAEK